MHVLQNNGDEISMNKSHLLSLYDVIFGDEKPFIVLSHFKNIFFKDETERRILIDEEGYGWDEAWEITQHSCAYTNHTILAEALEKWPVRLFQPLLPRIYMITEEINRRYSYAYDAFGRINLLCGGA